MCTDQTRIIRLILNLEFLTYYINNTILLGSLKLAEEL